jgi:hypothetical protein
MREVLLPMSPEMEKHYGQLTAPERLYVAQKLQEEARSLEASIMLMALPSPNRLKGITERKRGAA